MEKWKLPDFSGWKINYRNYVYLDVPTWSLVFSKTSADNPPSTFEQDCQQYYWFGIEKFFTDPTGNAEGEEYYILDRGIFIKSWGFKDDGDSWQTAVLTPDGWRLFGKNIAIKFDFDFDDKYEISSVEINIYRKNKILDAVIVTKLPPDFM